MTITTLPTAPTRSDPANFNNNAEAFVAALPAFVTEANALAVSMDVAAAAAVVTNDAAVLAAAGSVTTAETEATDAALSATQAAAAQVATEAAAVGAKWVTSTVYAVGDVVWSPADFRSYRSKTAFTSTTDPSADPTNWHLISYDFLTAIDDTITDTAVAIFIYDTSLDSDQGAWRHRTQGTSWHRETLNTETRGKTRKFPAVAIIIAEISKVTIYDGDDPSLPMWMVFNGGGDWDVHLPSHPSGGLGSVKALNGSVFVGDISTSGYGLSFVSFIEDAAYNYSSVSHKRINNNIASRNSNNGAFYTILSSSNVLADDEVNNVAIDLSP